MVVLIFISLSMMFCIHLFFLYINLPLSSSYHPIFSSNLIKFKGLRIDLVIGEVKERSWRVRLQAVFLSDMELWPWEEGDVFDGNGVVIEIYGKFLWHL